VSAGEIPTHDGQSCVFVAVTDRQLRALLPEGPERAFHQLLEETGPALAERVRAARRAGALRAFPGLLGHLRRPYGPGWALVGDAGCFRDPITAHGITDALRDAEWLAEAVIDGSAGAFAAYQARRDAFARGFLDLTDEIASFEWDLDRAKALHLELSRSMSREVEIILGRKQRGEVASATDTAP
jgi:2-polyprenyl-6-methoxyphenol hydroxylase-like FAD-dependent oxidoreductase